MRLAIFPVLALLLTGCAGYKLGFSKPFFMQHVNTIAVPSFKNTTLAPRMEVLAASSVIRQFQHDGTYQIAPEETADAILDGTVAGIERRPARSLRGNVLATTEFELDVKLAYTVRERTTGKTLTQGNATGTTSFFVTGDLQQDEREALPYATERAAEQIVINICDGWQKESRN